MDANEDPVIASENQPLQKIVAKLDGFEHLDSGSLLMVIWPQLLIPQAHRLSTITR